MRVIAAPSGTHGFDCNDRVMPADARKLVAAGYRFALRYAPRIKAHAGDLTAIEVSDILHAGLALMVVQHVEAETGNGWIANYTKGHQYGSVAAQHSKACGVPLGTNVWLDLEDIAPGTPHQDVIQYCNAWYDEVAYTGYTPGIYVGYNPGLTASELYSRLKFEHYWGAYNVNSDQEPLRRGFQMRQKRELQIAGISYRIDPDVVMADKLGGLPLVCAPDEWDVG